MNTSKKNSLHDVDQIIQFGKDQAKKHSEDLGSQYAYLSGYLMGELIHAYELVRTMKDRIEKMEMELNSIKEIL